MSCTKHVVMVTKSIFLNDNRHSCLTRGDSAEGRGGWELDAGGGGQERVRTFRIHELTHSKDHNHSNKIM